MPQIMTLTLNPALDLSTTAPHVEPGPKLRCTVPSLDPGGGGVNVSRAIRILGGTSLAVLALGGGTGQQLGDLLDAEGITTCRFAIPGETRQSLAVTESATGAQYRFVMPGPIWTSAEESEFLAMIGRLLRGGEKLVLSGSMPDGVELDFSARINALGGSIHADLAVDTSGPAQRWLVENPQELWLMRMDAEEARAITHLPIESREDTAALARDLVARGVARHIVIGRGADGSVMATPDACLHCRSDAREIRSKVGAGDSLTGALVLSLSRSESPADALRHGVSAATAAVMTDATDLCRAQDVAALLPQATVTTL